MLVVLLLLPCTPSITLLPVCCQRLQQQVRQGRCTLRNTLCCTAQPQHIIYAALQLMPRVCIAWGIVCRRVCWVGRTAGTTQASFSACRQHKAPGQQVATTLPATSSVEATDMQN